VDIDNMLSHGFVMLLISEIPDYKNTVKP